MGKHIFTSLVLVCLVGCGELGDMPAPPPLPEGGLSALNCTQFQKYEKQVKDSYAKSGTKGGTPGIDDMPIPESGDTNSAVPMGGGSSSQGASNKQKASDVEEADFVQVDGSNIYIVRTSPAGYTMGEFASFSVDSAGKISRGNAITLQGTPQEFLLTSDKALIISSTYNADKTWGTTLYLISITSNGFTLDRSFFVEDSSYITSRLIGTSAHIVTRKQVLDDVLPTYSTTTSAGGTTGTLGSCGTTFIPAEAIKTDGSDVQTLSVMAPSFSKLLSVTSVSLKGGELSSSAVVVDSYSEIVSVNKSGIYIGTDLDFGKNSEIYRFDFKSDKAAFVARGKVPGSLYTRYTGGGYNNQFSIDEYGGYIRVATTLAQTGTTSSGQTMESSLYVLNQEGSELKVTGSLKNLHDNEAIYAVRFMGKRGYVVTFRKIDPLFVIDLSDPTKPAKIGELKVPGFSTYLSEVDSNTLLAIGKEVDATGTVPTGIQLSLFDISDPTQPKLIDSESVTKKWATSEALSDHRAFSYFASRGLLAIPVSEYDYETCYSSKREDVWKVDLKNGFSVGGSISHDDLTNTGGGSVTLPYCGGYGTGLRRGLEVNGVFVTISDVGVKSHGFDDLTKELGSVGF